MITKIEGIPKKDRQVFKAGVLTVSPKFRVLFIADNANIVYDGDYTVTDETLEEKGKAKKALQQFITEFRQYQFNR